MNADLIMFFFCKNRQGQLGQDTVKQQTTGVKIQSTVMRHTHIFFDILRFDSLVWGVCWIESPKGEAAKKAITRRESRVYVKCCFGSYMRFTFKANQPSVLQQMKEGDSGSGKPQWDWKKWQESARGESPCVPHVSGCILRSSLLTWQDAEH